MATVILPESLARLFDGLPRSLELPGESVIHVLDLLEDQHPGVRDRLCAGGSIRRHIKIFVDGEPAGLQTPLLPQSEVVVVPAVSGG